MKWYRKWWESANRDDRPTVDWDVRPEVLTHPNIPKPLHGLAPRSLKGQAWWDGTRQKAYASTGFRCVACGVHKSEAKKHKWLEAHEFWNINYSTGICEVESIVPLCHYCHNFIHSGRLSMLEDVPDGKSREEIKEILEHGFTILKKHDLKAFFGTLDVANYFGAKTFNVKAAKINSNPNIGWSDWKLILEGKEYRSKFADMEEWAEFYKIL